MGRRLISLLLAMAFALSLTACGQQKRQSGSSEEKQYASDHGLNPFEAIEAIRNLKDLTFDLRVSTVNPETGETVRTKYTASGAWYTSTKQASLTVALEDQSVLTSAVLDGDRLYTDAATAANTLSEHFAALDGEEYQYDSQEMKEAAAAFSKDYVSFQLKEDPWTALESGGLSKTRADLKALYGTVEKGNRKRVSMGDLLGTLSLGLGDLQGTLLDITGNLLKYKSDYQAELAGVLSGGFEAVLNASGWDAEDLLEEKWTEYEETYETLAALQTAGDYNGWTAKLETCGDEENGYTIDLTLNFDDPVNYFLNVYPAEAQPVAVPEESTDNGEVADEVLALYRGAKEYFAALSDLSDSEGVELTEDEVKENFGDTDSFSGKVETAPVEGYDSLLATNMVTDDGVRVTVPLLAVYDDLQGESIAEGVNDVFESSNGYVMEFVSMEKRDIEQAVGSNAKMYETEFKESWGYEITQTHSQTFVSKDRSAAVAGMGYYDSDEKQDVTVITGCIDVPDSEYMLCFDLFTYSKSVTNQEISAIQDFLTYLGLEMPITVTQN